MTTSTAPTLKVVAAILTSVVAVVWHVMACVESPMSFSPSGDLAFTVVDPYPQTEFNRYYAQDEEWAIAGTRTYRLMVLDKDGNLREIERSTTHQLSAPTYSPDGSRIVYLRIPLLTREDKDRFEGMIKEWMKKTKVTEEKENRFYVMPESAKPNISQMLEGGSRRLSLEGEYMQWKHSMGPQLPVEVIERDLKTGTLAESRWFQVPVMGEHFHLSFAFNFGTNRPLYILNRKGFVMLVNGWVVGFDLISGSTVYLFDQAWGMRSSPSKHRLVGWGQKRVKVMEKGKLTYFWLESEPNLSGVDWVDNETLAVLHEIKPDDKCQVVIDFYSNDGNLLESRISDLCGKWLEGEALTGDFAVSPNGAYMIVGGGDRVHFLTVKGELLSSWSAEEEKEGEAGAEFYLAHPTFSQDSRVVAFKLFNAEEGDMHTEAIVFFTPQGREIKRFAIPRAVPEVTTGEKGDTGELPGR